MGNFITDFFSGPEVGQFNDPYTGQLQAIQNQLQSGQLGKDVSSQATGFIRRQAADNLRTISNSGAGRNASVLSRLSDKTQTTADQGVIGAQVEGERINQSALGQAASIGESNRNFAYNDFERQESERRQPSPFESLLNTAVGSLTGGLTAGLAGSLFQNKPQTNGNGGPMGNYDFGHNYG